MALFGRTYNGSPVLTMSPQPAHQGLLAGPLLPHQLSSSGQPAASSRAPIRNSFSVAGRKRSRDEAAPNLDPPDKVVESPIIKEPEEEWVYGPGMTLIKRSTGYVADAGSQSGTWVEEKAAEEEARKMEAALRAQAELSQERPSLRSHKSQRLQVTPSLPSADGPQGDHSDSARELGNPAAMPSDPLAQPVVDDFTVHLGIGWSRISDEEHIQAAARGWARYINNHFPVTDAKVLLESRGLQSYLVESNEGFFLFAEDLRQGRLVSKDAERALNNLKTSPPTFDGPETIDAAETPRPVDTASEPILTGVPAMSTDIDMI